MKSAYELLHEPTVRTPIHMPESLLPELKKLAELYKLVNNIGTDFYAPTILYNGAKGRFQTDCTLHSKALKAMDNGDRQYGLADKLYPPFVVTEASTVTNKDNELIVTVPQKVEYFKLFDKKEALLIHILNINNENEAKLCTYYYPNDITQYENYNDTTELRKPVEIKKIKIKSWKNIPNIFLWAYNHTDGILRKTYPEDFITLKDDNISKFDENEKEKLKFEPLIPYDYIPILKAGLNLETGGMYSDISVQLGEPDLEIYHGSNDVSLMFFVTWVMMVPEYGTEYTYFKEISKKEAPSGITTALTNKYLRIVEKLIDVETVEQFKALMKNLKMKDYDRYVKSLGKVEK